jgi:hypothetical protein
VDPESSPTALSGVVDRILSLNLPSPSTSLRSLCKTGLTHPLLLLQAQFHFPTTQDHSSISTANPQKTSSTPLVNPPFADRAPARGEQPPSSPPLSTQKTKQHRHSPQHHNHHSSLPSFDALNSRRRSLPLGAGSVFVPRYEGGDEGGGVAGGVGKVDCTSTSFSLKMQLGEKERTRNRRRNVPFGDTTEAGSSAKDCC